MNEALFQRLRGILGTHGTFNFTRPLSLTSCRGSSISGKKEEKIHLDNQKVSTISTRPHLYLFVLQPDFQTQQKMHLFPASPV
jgi:hypothetical protein